MSNLLADRSRQQLLQMLRQPAAPDQIFKATFLLLSKHDLANQKLTVLDKMASSALSLFLPLKNTVQVAYKHFMSRFKRSQYVKGLQGILVSFSEMPNKKKYFQQSLKDDLQDFGTRKREIALLKFANKQEEYIRALQNYLEINPADQEVWLQLAEIYHLNFNYAKMLFCLQEFLLLNQKSLPAMVRIAETLMTLGGERRLQTAREYLSFVYGSDNKNLRSLMLLIKVERQLQGPNSQLLKALQQQLNSHYRDKKIKFKL